MCVNSTFKNSVAVVSFAMGCVKSAIHYFSSQSYLHIQILMIVQVIPVRTTGPVQTESTDSIAAAHQDFMEAYVKKVPVHFSSYFS